MRITGSEDIHLFVDFFNSLNFQPLGYDNIKGWQFRIHLTNDTDDIYFISDKVSISGKWYAIDSDAINKLDVLYKNYNYKKEIWKYPNN